MRSPTTVVHIPHASVVVPDDVRASIVLGDSELEHELLLMTDRYTDELFQLPDVLATTITYPVSRLVVDPERFVDDQHETMARVGMGVIYTKTSSGQQLRKDPTVQEREKLLSAYFAPHHQRLSDAVAAAVAEHGRCLIVDAHSFPSKPLPHEPDQAPDRCDICIGTDDVHTPKWLADFAVAEFRKHEYRVELNRPFAGALVPSDYYHQDRRVMSVMVEVNRRLYIDEKSGGRLAEFAVVAGKVQDCLASLVAAVKP